MGPRTRASSRCGSVHDAPRLRKMGLETSIADVLHNLAHLAQAQGHYPLAARLYQESLALFSKQGNEQGISKCRAGLAAVAGVQESSNL